MGLKILIAEDSATNRLLFSTVMTRLGHAADVVATGAEAAELFTRSVYDIVFLDLNMPGLNGIETAMRLKKNNPRHIPVYAISGYPSADMVAQFGAAGLRGCIIKPLDREKLEDVMRDCGLCKKALSDAPVPGITAETQALPRRVLETCMRELRSRAQAALQFLAADDRAALWREAHTVRALADMLGMQVLSDSAGCVETSCAANDVKALPKDVARMADACEETARCLDRLLGNM